MVSFAPCGLFSATRPSAAAWAIGTQASNAKAASHRRGDRLMGMRFSSSADRRIAIHHVWSRALSFSFGVHARRLGMAQPDAVDPVVGRQKQSML